MNPRCRRKSAAALAGAILVATVAAPPMASGAMTSTLGGIRLNTTGDSTILATRAAVDDFANWPVTYQTGETVTATAPDGTVSTLAQNAASAGSVAFAPTAGGLWKLVNSSGETALVGVAWSVFGDGSSQDFGPYTPFRMDTVGEGPNRKSKAGNTPPVAYTGDNWAGDASKASTLTFTPPMGSGISASTQAFTGTGATPFRFRGSGDWAVRLEMADGTTLNSVVTIVGGTVFFVR